jgi:3-hydroxybutyryl-CoA dehydrogenase
VILRSRTARSGADAVEAIDAAGSRGRSPGTLDPERACRDPRPDQVTDRARRLLADCDLVIESVVEDLAVKKDLFAELEQIVPRTVLATNTSTLPVVELAMATAPRPRVRHPLLQPGARDEARRGGAADHRQRRHDRRAIAFAESCGKEPITVADRAGFVVNALLFPYLNNAIRMLERARPTKESIDAR